MQFSRAASLFVFFFTLCSFILANPLITAEKRDNAAIESVLETLKSSTDSILPQINSLASSGNATDATVDPLIAQLTSALNTASSSLSSLESSSRARVKRQSEDEIASLVAGIISDIATSLDALLATASTIPDLGGLLSGVDTALNQVLSGLETLLSGVLNLVATLLVDVAGLLRNLAFGLTLASLGL